MVTQTSNALPTDAVLDMSWLWDDLVCGRVRILESFASAERNYLSFELQPLARHRPPDAAFRLLEVVLLGTPQKTVAIEADLAASTVATSCREAFRYMGLTCRPSKAPPLLCLIAAAARQPALAALARLCEVEQPVGPFRTLGAPRLERYLCHRFSPAQTDVIRLLLDGHSYAEIARARGTSLRTVANQIAAVTAALKVSGRLGLIRLLMTSTCTKAVKSS